VRPSPPYNSISRSHGPSENCQAVGQRNRRCSSGRNWGNGEPTANSTLIKYTRQAIDRCREKARRRVLYLCYVPHLPKKCCKNLPRPTWRIKWGTKLPRKLSIFGGIRHSYSWQKTRMQDLTSEQKQENQKKARKRIVVEPLIRLLNIFRVAAERFRWKRENYEPVILVVCGLITWRIAAILRCN
jgi:hypothetical protein